MGTGKVDWGVNTSTTIVQNQKMHSTTQAECVKQKSKMASVGPLETLIKAGEMCVEKDSIQR